MVAIVAGLAAVASFARPRLALVLALTAITALLVTAGLGVFHAGVEYHWWQGPQSCSGTIPRGLSAEQLKKYLLGAAMVRCDAPAWTMWGISMAGWNAILSAALACLAGFARGRLDQAAAMRGPSRTGEIRNPGDPDAARAGRARDPRRPGGRIRRRAHLRGPARGPALDRTAERRRRPQDRRHGARRTRAPCHFDRLIAERRVRPTVLSPLWSMAGFALGAATALMGDKAAMACTVAIEETIDEHYASQAAALGDDEAELRTTIEKFRAEEIAHKDEALAAGAEQAPGYEALTAAIKAGSRLAIWLSTRDLRKQASPARSDQF